MSDDPKFVGVPAGKDPTVAKYMEGLAKRAKQQGEQHRVPVPNLQQAQESFNPKKEGAMTLAQIGQAQRNVEAASQAGEDAGRRELSPQTARGLQALQAEVQKQKAEQDMTKEAEPGEKAQAEPVKKTAEEKADQENKDKVRLREALDDTDDLELEYLLARSRQDLINNEEQRKLIESKVKPMDLSDGILTGEFAQLVPIKPGVLEVKFRTISPMEMEHIRRLVLEMQLRDERMSNLSVDRFTLMQTVAAIVHINGQALPSHVKNPGTVNAEFLDDVFLQKYSIIGGYPSPMIHSLSTHLYWFDLRVRKLFSIEDVKNG